MLTNDMGLVAEVALAKGEEGLRELTLKPESLLNPC